ncbi:NAD(P)H-dependent oxidoreductase [Sphingomonas sp. HF-S3]|uniref:FMN dependent NADH:quinone oxidoreductase n=1 Tax=Sphingomonas rustica TaxID=3103142 RepID=A0ABV0B8W0_9SPHN
MKLLHIDSGIQGERSASRALSAAVVDRLRSDRLDLAVVRRDLVADPIDHLLPGDLAGGEADGIASEFLDADIVVIGTGLYNFTIPTQLKAWVDRILIPGRTFLYGEAGPEGLAGGKRVIVTLARGGIYSPGSPAAPLEHAETYLRGVLAFIGITDPEFVIAEGLALGEDARAAAVSAAMQRANDVAGAVAA